MNFSQAMGRKLHSPEKGRGALSSLEGRFETIHTADDPDFDQEEALPDIETELFEDRARSIITRNTSPDISFEQSINAYRGCEHGCIYCYARPAHAYLNLSPGLDFETKLFFKPQAAELLKTELAKPSYTPSPIALGTNTDPYQPIERTLGITRSIIEIFDETNHPFTIVTKSTLIERDLPLLASMANRRLVSVMISVTTLDNDLKRLLEPRTPSGRRRVRTIKRLCEAGIDTGVFVAPVIPRVNDHEMEAIMAVCRDAGARRAGYVLIRLPHEVKALFKEWLEAHMPERAEHVMELIRQCHGGEAYDPRFGKRMRGEGPVAEIIERRFEVTKRKLGFATEKPELDLSRFRPVSLTGQLDLFE